jgi:hypothetical protein
MRETTLDRDRRANRSPPSQSRSVQQWVGFAVLSVLYLVSRVGFLAFVAPYEVDLTGWHLIDPVLLKTDLVHSVFRMHADVPLYSLITGTALKLAPQHPEWILGPFALGAGLAQQLLLFTLMLQLRVRFTLALAASIVFMLSPGGILFDTMNFKTPLLGALLIAMPVTLHRWIDSGRSGAAIAFLACGTALIWLKPFYQLLWLLPAAIAILCVHRAWRRPRLVAASLALLLVASAPTLRNWALYDWPVSSTWVGMNFARLALSPITQPRLAEMREKGIISDIALIKPFSPLEAYPLPLPPRTGIPLLDDTMKSVGVPNRHHLGYIRISRIYMNDSLAVIRANPMGYAKAVAGAMFLYFMPSHDWFMSNGARFQRERDAIAPLETLYNALYGRISSPDQGYGLRGSDNRFLAAIVYVPWLLVAAYVFGSAAAVIVLLRARSLVASGSITPAQIITVAFLLYTVCYNAALGSTMELTENMRFRFDAETLAVALVAFGIERLARRRSAAPAWESSAL